MVDLTEDRELLAAFREGQRDALEQVYRHHVNEIATFLKHGFTYASGGAPVAFSGFKGPLELAAAVQEVFVRAFEPRTRTAYDGLRPYGGFLIGIARNVALKEIEREAVQRRRSVSLDDVEVAGATDPVEADLDERRGSELVTKFLASDCDDTDRKLFQLRYDDGLGQEAAGKAVGLTRIQVRRWEKRLHARLSRYLRRTNYLDER